MLLPSPSPGLRSAFQSFVVLRGEVMGLVMGLVMGDVMGLGMGDVMGLVMGDVTGLVMGALQCYGLFGVLGFIDGSLIDLNYS